MQFDRYGVLLPVIGGGAEIGGVGAGDWRVGLLLEYYRALQACSVGVRLAGGSENEYVPQIEGGVVVGVGDVVEVGTSGRGSAGDGRASSVVEAYRRFVEAGTQRAVGGVGRGVDVGNGGDSEGSTDSDIPVEGVEPIRECGDGVEEVERAVGEKKHVVGSVGVAGSVAGGKNLERNRQWRAERKARKVRKQGRSAGLFPDRVPGAGGSSGGVSVPEWRRGAGCPGGYFSELAADERKELMNSRARRLKAENELKEARAKKQLEVELARDVDQVVRAQRAKLLKQAECDKVQVEKAYAYLAKTGNVPGVGGSVSGGGSAKTVVSGASSSELVSGTISPNSSVSMKEVRELQKAFESQKLEFESQKLELAKYKKMAGEAGFSLPEEEFSVKSGWTVDEKGELMGYNVGVAPISYYIGKDGRAHDGEPEDYYDNW